MDLQINMALIHMRAILLFHFFIFMILSGYSQNISPKNLRGTYSQTTGEPGRSYDKADGSRVSLPPVTYSKTTLKIKRGKKAKIETVAYTSLAINSLRKAKWEIKNDTLVLSFDDRKEEYKMKKSDGSVIFLIPLAPNQYGYSREY